MKPSILVAGSSNTDMVIKTSRLPEPGETILGGTFFMNAGGKGANQAVAAARLNGNVTFVAKTGNDIFGKEAIQLFAKEGMHTGYIFTDPVQPSGVALITVDDNGENCITVAPGANAMLLPADIEQSWKAIEQAAIILVQLEIPVETIHALANMAAQKNIPLVLNPAPAQTLPDELLKMVSIITPNQKETEMLTGIAVTNTATAEQAAQQLHNKGIETIIITMGSQGAFVYHNNESLLIPAPKVKAVDSTAAGDVFNGALVVALAEGMTMHNAVTFACNAAAISVTRLGAQASAPYRNEVTN